MTATHFILTMQFLLPSIPNFYFVQYMDFTTIYHFSVDLCSNNGNGECSTGVAGKLHLSLVITHMYKYVQLFLQDMLLLVECVLSQEAVLLMRIVVLAQHLSWLMKLDTSKNSHIT